MKQDNLFVFVTANGRVMARLSDGTIVDVTDRCDLLPRHVCAERQGADGNGQAARAA